MQTLPLDEGPFVSESNFQETLIRTKALYSNTRFIRNSYGPHGSALIAVVNELSPITKPVSCPEDFVVTRCLCICLTTGKKTCPCVRTSRKPSTHLYAVSRVFVHKRQWDTCGYVTFFDKCRNIASSFEKSWLHLL